MLAAAIQAACERGGGNVTVAQVVGRAGVSRRTFYEIFSDSEDCLLAAFDEAVGRVSERVVYAYRTSGRWRERIRAALVALLELFDEEPDVGRFLMVEMPAVGTRALQRRQEVLAAAMAAIEEGGAEANDGAASPFTAEAIVGAAFTVVHGRMLVPGKGRLVELVNPLMSIVVLPYLGLGAARRELRRPMVLPAASPPKAIENPLKQLDIRLTYRTIRVIAAVAAAPRSSNRAIADAAGIVDQGQVSKLLGRLERLGLIENRGGPASRGEPNAWTLTRAGREVHSVIADRASAA
jgi:AcrR family transcriptional regulator/DNA-binding MarR family transcriptional regulator